LIRILIPAERIEPIGASITSTIRLTTRLNPNERIDKGVTSGSSGTHAETRALDVAPVAPFLAETGDGVAASVDDGLGRHAGGLELGAEERNVLLLVLGLVPLCVGGFAELAWGEVVCVPASDVSRDTANLLGGACGFVDVGEALGTGLCGVC
jgi:hypothetical protein